jgi:hypothetical protein
MVEQKEGCSLWMGGISEWWMLSGGAREMERLREADLWAGESQVVGSEQGNEKIKMKRDKKKKRGTSGST